MRKGEVRVNHDLRPEYKRADFTRLVRGKYVDRLKASSNVVVIDPAVTHRPR